MTTKEYDNDDSVTMASEPNVTYVSSASSPIRTGIPDSMTVDEYFDKVKRALDKRYENL